MCIKTGGTLLQMDDFSRFDNHPVTSRNQNQAYNQPMNSANEKTPRRLFNLQKSKNYGKYAVNLFKRGDNTFDHEQNVDDAENDPHVENVYMKRAI